MNKRSTWRNLAAIAVLATAVTASHAADVNARIRGTVTDPAGAVIPNVQVTATNQQTGVKFTTTSQANGDYRFQQLPIGTYNISASAPGFKGFSATGITLNIDQEYVELVKLTVGDTSQNVEVQADPVQVNTTDMQLGNVVDHAQIVELPLIGRAFTNLEQILPGVQASNDRFGSFSVNGSQTQQSSYIINGADSNDLPLNTISIQPNIDALAQFNLVTGPLNAEYDRNSGAIVSTTIIQGTNHFHGDAFEFYRDTFLNTANYFGTDPVTGAKPRPKYHQNIYGGTIGGPIIKDKLFFFGAYQGQRAKVPQGTGTATVTTPSIGQLAGNFSTDATNNVFSSNPIPGTVVIPGCGPIAGVAQTFAQCLGTSTTKGSVAANGNVPTSAFNPLSLSLLKTFLPAPTANGTYTFGQFTQQSQDQAIGRFDYNINSKNQLTALGIYQRFPSTDTIPFTGANVPGFGDYNTSTIYQFTTSYISQLSSTAVNDFQLHYTRFNYGAVLPSNVVQPSTLGFGIASQNPQFASVPLIAVSGTFSLGFSNNGPQPRIDQVYQADDNFSKTFGHHNFKIGYDGRRYNVDNPFYGNNNGTFAFNTQGTFSSGDAQLDYLLGIPASYSQGSGGKIDAKAYLNYFYAQDTWKATDSLTISYGIGYQIDTPLHNKQYGGEGVTCFIPGQQSKIFPTATVGLNFPGDPGCNDAQGLNTKYTDFGPRIGFAFAPSMGFLTGGQAKKLSIRGGFGIYYNRSEEETSLNNLQEPPFGLSSGGAGDYGGVASFANPYKDVDTGTVYKNKFPFVAPKTGQAFDFSQEEPYDLNQYAPGFRSPYSENFQLTVERELPARTIARLSYVGTLGRHNQVVVEGNPITAAGQKACLASATCIANRNLQAYYYPSHLQNGYADPVLGGANAFLSVGETQTSGSSSYHSLQASIDKGITHGLNVQASYTYSHSLDNGSSYEGSGYGGSNRGYNQFVPSLNYGDSNFDARHRFVFSPIYRVPFRSGGNSFSLYNLAAAGWEVSAISTFATGFPFDITYGGSTSRSLYCSASTSFYACPDVPNQIAPLVRQNVRTRIVNASTGLTTQYTGGFLTTSFASETIGSFGNVHRNPYHGPGILNTNMVVSKNIPFSADSSRYLQLRIEGDNAFNHTQFGNPDGNIADSTFGYTTSAASGRQIQLGAKIYF